MATKIIKYLGLKNVYWMYTENYKALLKDIEKYIWNTWFLRINIVIIAILTKAIHRFNAVPI